MLRRWRQTDSAKVTLLAVGVVAVVVALRLLPSAEIPSLLQPAHDHTLICPIPQKQQPTSLWLLLLIGLTTGASHCVGMCGPLVSLFVTQRRRHDVSPLVLYQFGRITTYTLYGAILGTIGATIQVAAFNTGWQASLSIFLGFFLLLAGLSLAGVLPLLRWLESAWLAQRVGRWIGQLRRSQHPAAPFALGLTNGLLPCGAVYAVALLALASGDIVRGATIMFVFGLGTLPAMLGVGWLAMRLPNTARAGLFRFATLLLMLVGVQLVLRGLAASGYVSHFVLGGIIFW